MKRILPIFVFLYLLVFSNSNVFALELKSIGALSLGGKSYTEWWYTGVNPTLMGTAKASSDVKVTVGTTNYDTKADASGNWTVNATAPIGEYNVSIVGDATTYAFKLHLGKDMSGAASAGSTAPGAVPSTGINQIVSILFSLGILLLASYFYFWGSQNNNSKFEKYFLNN